MVENTQDPKGQSASPQDNPQQKKFADTFSSTEELEKAYKEERTKIAELGEKLARSEEMLNTFLNSYPPAENKPEPKPEQTSGTPKEDYYEKIKDNPKEVFERFGQEVETRVIGKITRAYQQEQYNKSIFSYFYGKYPDLKDHRTIVGAISAQVQAENPRLPVTELLDAVAKKTREYIGNLRASGQGTPPTVVTEGGQPSPERGTPSPNEPEKVLSNEENLHEFMAERNKERLKHNL